MGTVRRESDLAEPVRDFLITQGYTVRSEVKDCDITAVKDDELIVVELKRGFTMELLIQAVDRQRVADSVYVAIPFGSKSPEERYSKAWRGREMLLKRLELGLIFVTFGENETPLGELRSKSPAVVEVVFHPIREPRPRNKPRKRRAILREIAGRSDDYNVGGVTKQEILTAYREQAIFLAICLDRFGPRTPSALRLYGGSQKTQSILHRNVYGWFERLDRGLYTVRPQVIEHLCATWPHVVAHHRAQVEERLMLPDE